MQYSYVLVGLAAVASAQEFTSIYNITATPDQVVNSAGAPAPGPAGAIGQFNYAINSKTDVICYDITLVNFVGAYQSPAKTATHLHEGVKGKAGPPRIAFPNPVGDDRLRQISGCLIGPFTTGLKMADNVTDTGAGFRLSQIEANPAGFFTDSHSALFPAGVIRGQLDQKFEILEPKPEGYPTEPKPEGYPTEPKPVGYPTEPKPVGYPTEPKPVGYPTGPAYPATTDYPASPAHPEYPTEDDDEITTATLTKTVQYTISKCNDDVKDCPYKTKPVVTKTEEIYTTVCPKSELTQVYPATKPYETIYKPAETHPVYQPGKPVETYPGKPVVTLPGKPVETYPGKPVETHPVYPVETHPVYPVETHPVYPVETHPVYPVETHPVYPVETYPAKPVETHPSNPVNTIQTYPVVKPTPIQSYQPTGSSPAYPVFTGAASANKVGGLLIAAGFAAALL